MFFIKEKKYIIFLLIILFIAAFFRLYKLNSIPPGLYPDVAINGNDALDILETDKLKVFYPENNGREGLFFWLIALSFWIFGSGIWSIKIVAAVFGILTVLGTYLLTKELFKTEANRDPISVNYRDRVSVSWKNEIIALLASFFIAISFWHVNFSRIGFRAIMAPFFLIYGFYFLFRGFRSKQLYSFIISGIFFGLGFYSYISYRFVVLIMAIILLGWYFIYKKEGFKKSFIQYTRYLILTTFIVALPLGIYFIVNSQDFFGRAADVSVLTQPNPLLAFLKSLIVHLGMFNIYGDANWRHNFAGSPQLLWPIGIFFLIGLILTIKEILYHKNNWLLVIGHWSLIVWFIAMLLPGVLSREGIPHALRTIGIIPVPYIFAGMGAYWLFEKIKRFYLAFSRTKFSLTIFYIFIFIFLFSLVFAEFNKYFVLWSKNQEVKAAFSEDLLDIGNYLNSLPDNINKYVVVNLSGVAVPYPNGIPMPAQTPMFIERLKYGKIRSNYILPKDLSSIRIERNAIFMPLHYDESVLEEIIIAFPEGKLEKEGGIWTYKIK